MKDITNENIQGVWKEDYVGKRRNDGQEQHKRVAATEGVSSRQRKKKGKLI